MIARCGRNVKIADGVRILNWQNLDIGDNVSINTGCYIDAAGGIIIGNNVSIAHHSTILSSTHTWDDISLPIKYNPIVLGRTVICDDVWIGCACRIIAGVTINSRSVIASGAVVNRDIDSNSVYAGIPAKKIKGI
ncbi:MAG: acyltransferase [Rikenellaceae bacterium]|nr:acyltransferase [Rikenellaceae bacterium]